MTEQKINFDDGATYERTMGVWTRLAGDAFLNWLNPAKNLQWIDVGCGNGAFTEMVANRCAPASLKGIDPSVGQIEFARNRAERSITEYGDGNAMALPFPDASCDVAVMALVIFFVPEPLQGVAEMVRVARPGGIVTSYSWDILGGGFPVAALQSEMRAMGLPTPQAPSAEASQRDALLSLWSGAGLTDIELDEITVSQSFPDFEDCWSNMTSFGSVRGVQALEEAVRTELKDRVRARIAPARGGTITCSARAFAIRGRTQQKRRIIQRT